MKSFAILAITLFTCGASSAWSGQAIQQNSKPALFDIVFDIVTAPCQLLATCLGLDTNSGCETPKKIKITKVSTKKLASPPVKTSETKAPPTVSKATVQEKQTPSNRNKPRTQQPTADDRTVPIKQFTAPENKPSPQITGTLLPDKSSVPVSASEPRQTKTQDAKTNSEKKQGTESTPKGDPKETPAVGTVGESPSKSKAPELSPPKVEQSSSQEPKKPEASNKKRQEGKKKPRNTNYFGHPCAPFYQPYPSCGPRFFFR